MQREKTVNAAPTVESCKKDWYLSLKSPSPKQTISVQFEDGKQYKYLGTGKVNVGDPVVIDFGGATSYMMGNVVAAEDGITIKRTHALKPLFTFSTNPQKTEIKKNFEGIKKLESVGEVSGYFKLGTGEDNANKFRVVDYLTLSVLNAITIIAHPDLATQGMIAEAKAFLAEERPVPGIVFSREFTDMYYGIWFDTLRYSESAEVILTGQYPGWDDDLLKCSFWSTDEFNKLRIETEWNDNKTGYYLYFKDGSKPREKFFSNSQEFKTITNELVMRSALSVIIRGGFTNLLKAALSVEMPIKGFYQKLIAFSDEIGSVECSKMLKGIDYENMSFPKELKEEKKEMGKAKAQTGSKDFKMRDDILVEYKGKGETVVIPDGIKTIEEFAFSENKTVKKVIIPDSVTQIKKCAFSYCDGLEEVVLGKNVSSLGNGCFYECKNLRTIDLSDTKVKSISNSVFEHCESLRSLDLSKTKITSIRMDPFASSGIESIQLPQKLETIGSRAFWGTKIEELHIPETVKKIDYQAFNMGHGGSTFLKKISFEGTSSCDFKPSYVGCDCIIECKKDSELYKKLEEDNAYLQDRYARYPRPEDKPRTVVGK